MDPSRNTIEPSSSWASSTSTEPESLSSESTCKTDTNISTEVIYSDSLEEESTADIYIPPEMMQEEKKKPLQSKIPLFKDRERLQKITNRAMGRTFNIFGSAPELTTDLSAPAATYYIEPRALITRFQRYKQGILEKKHLSPLMEEVEPTTNVEPITSVEPATTVEPTTSVESTLPTTKKSAPKKSFWKKPKFFELVLPSQMSKLATTEVPRKISPVKNTVTRGNLATNVKSINVDKGTSTNANKGTLTESPQPGTSTKSTRPTETKGQQTVSVPSSGLGPKPLLTSQYKNIKSRYLTSASESVLDDTQVKKTYLRSRTTKTCAGTTVTTYQQQSKYTKSGALAPTTLAAAHKTQTYKKKKGDLN